MLVKVDQKFENDYAREVVVFFKMIMVDDVGGWVYQKWLKK